MEVTQNIKQQLTSHGHMGMLYSGLEIAGIWCKRGDLANAKNIIEKTIAVAVAGNYLEKAKREELLFSQLAHFVTTLPLHDQQRLLDIIK
jgi:hypothetical protein